MRKTNVAYGEFRNHHASLHYPLSTLFSKKTSEVPAVPRQFFLDLLFCYFSWEACHPPSCPSAADISFIPVLPTSHLCISHMVCTYWISSHSLHGQWPFHTDCPTYWETSSDWEVAEGRRESKPHTSQGLAQAEAAPNQPRKVPSSWSPSWSSSTHWLKH